MLKKMLIRGSKRCVLLVSLLMLAVATFAVPAKPGLKRVLTLTDGTTVTATLVGDEYAHYWLGADGKTYQAAGDEVFESVDVQAVKQRADQRRSAANQRRVRRLAPQKVGEVGGITGDKKGIIILVNFKNKSFTATQSDFNKLANQVNYNSGNFKGSMYDYFYAQSEGQFRLTFDVVGPYTVSNNYSYYGANDSQGNDKYPATMVIEALKLADPDVNYADYDWDGDGEVDQVYVVYAGKGEADGGASNTIWPHEWQLSQAATYGDGSGVQTLDGVKIDTYACGGEQNGQTGATAGIGTMCHEFSHCLGYPDFYDTDYSGGQGMFEWDLMDSGSYNDDGYRPAGYTSYERWVAGWKEPIELNYTQNITNMAALQDNGSKTYIIYNKGHRDEYYLLENRQKTKWDTNLPGAGLLILHVDYDATVWANNQPNDTPSRQRMTWIAADNQYQYTTYQGTKYYTEAGAANDPFPYGSVNAFNKNTTPAAKFNNKNADNTYYLDSSVENITQNSDGTISFRFVGLSNVAPPTFSPAPGRYAEAQTVSISCESTGATIYYTLDGTTPTTTSNVYSSPLTISATTTVKAIAVKDGELSEEVTATYKIGTITSDPNTTTFKRVNSVDDLEDGLRYIIACGSKSTAAGKTLSTTSSAAYLGSQSVTVDDDVITIDNNVGVFVLEGDQTNGWTFKNESSNQYLYATAAKKLAYSSSKKTWTLSNVSNGTAGVIMTYGDYGTMLYNVNSPRFTTYTSDPTASMIQSNLYMEYSEGTPITKEDVVMSFSPATAEATIGEAFTQPTLSTTPEGLTVTYSSSNTGVATVDANTGEVALISAGTTVITATFAGDDDYNEGSASYTLTVSPSTTPVSGTGKYALVTDASTLAEGDKILLAYVSDEDCLVLSTTQNDNNRAATNDVTLNNDETLTPGVAAQIITLEKDGNNYLFNVGDGYLYAASNSKNYLRTEVTADANAKATISISEGDATITFQGSNTRNIIRYNPNNGTPIFSCYASSSTVVTLPQIYREVTVPSITLANAEDNSSVITRYNGKLANVTLGNRTLFKDGSWNTLCLPFNVALEGSPLENATVMELDPTGTYDTDKQTGYDATTGTLYLYFKVAESIEAGKPYIVKWEEAEDVVEPVFQGVTIVNGTAATITAQNSGLNKVQFVGIYAPAAIYTDAHNNYYIGANNALKSPKAENYHLNAFRAYFNVEMDGSAAGVKNFVMSFRDETDGIESLSPNPSPVGEGNWYSIDGRRVEKGQLPRGIYITNGKKVVVK